MARTPNADIPLLEAGSLQIDAVFNEFAGIVEAWQNCVVLEVGRNAPSGTEVNGNRVIVGTGTGVFTGHDNELAILLGGTWQFHAPPAAGVPIIKNLDDGNDYECVAGVWAVKAGGSAALADGAYGDIDVSGSGTAMAISDGAVAYAKMQDVSATSRVLGRKTAGAGDLEELTLSELLDFVGSAADGDILYRSGGAWTRLAIGADTQVLTVAAGLPEWQAPAGGGMTNPMTSAGDIIYGGVSGAATRLAAGTDGHVLTLVSGSPGWAAAGGVTGFTASLNTSSPNATVNVSLLLASGGTTNQDVVIQPKGTGALCAQLADGTTAGGNKRGIRAVDLGMSRGNANQVAGDYAVVGGNSVRANGYGVAIGNGAAADGSSSYFGGVAIGRNASTSGNYGGGVAIGYNANSTGSDGGNVAVGQGCSATGGSGSVAIGLNASASATNATAIGGATVANAAGSSSVGAYATNRSRQALIALGVGNNKPQGVFWIGNAATTNATPTRMTADSSASAATTFSLPTGMSALVRVQVLATQTAGTGAGAVNGWVGDALVKNVGGTFTMVAGPLTQIGSEAWTAVLSGDNTLKALVVDVTGEASKSITWSVVFSGVER